MEAAASLQQATDVLAEARQSENKTHIRLHFNIAASDVTAIMKEHAQNYLSERTRKYI